MNIATIIFFVITSVSLGIEVDVPNIGSVSLEVEYFEKPLKVIENKLTDLSIEPEWFPAFIATSRFTELSYLEFSNYLTEDYQAEVGLEEKGFSSTNEQTTLSDIWLTNASILSVLSIKYQSREFRFVRFYRYGLLDSYKESKDLEYGTSTTILEKVDGSWKVQSGVAIGWLVKLLPINRAEMQKILKDRKMIITDQGRASSLMGAPATIEAVESESVRIHRIRNEHQNHIISHPEDVAILDILTSLTYPGSEIKEDLRDSNYATHTSFKSLLAKANWLRKYVDDPTSKLTTEEHEEYDCVTVHVYAKFLPTSEYDLKMKLCLGKEVFEKNVAVFKGRLNEQR